MKIIDHIAHDYHLDADYIARLVHNSDYYYRTYYISKTEKKKRRIQQPSAELKALQYWCCTNIFSLLPISKCAFAYIRGKSIKQHADAHKRNKYILHLDIENFFESITRKHLLDLLYKNKAIIESHDFEFSDVIDMIPRICLRHHKMCIGAVSSPMISNTLLYDFDKTISDYADSNGYIYTRYADDLYLSSSCYIDNNVVEYIKQELYKLNLMLNNKKTHFMSPNGRRQITGLIITNDSKLSIGLDKKNHIKKLLYEKMVNGNGDSSIILGYLSYIKDVEPSFYNRIITKYSKYGDINDKLYKN